MICRFRLLHRHIYITARKPHPTFVSILLQTNIFPFLLFAISAVQLVRHSCATYNHRYTTTKCGNYIQGIHTWYYCLSAICDRSHPELHSSCLEQYSCPIGCNDMFLKVLTPNTPVQLGECNKYLMKYIASPYPMGCTGIEGTPPLSITEL